MKKIFKLANNAVFEKTQENLRNQINVDVVTNHKLAVKRACKSNLKRSYKINEDLVVMEMGVTKLKLNKPINVRFLVLETSKFWMYKFVMTACLSGLITLSYVLLVLIHCFIKSKV